MSLLQFVWQFAEVYRRHGETVVADDVGVVGGVFEYEGSAVVFAGLLVGCEAQVVVECGDAAIETLSVVDVFIQSDTLHGGYVY